MVSKLHFPSVGSLFVRHYLSPFAFLDWHLYRKGLQIRSGMVVYPCSSPTLLTLRKNLRTFLMIIIRQLQSCAFRSSWTFCMRKARRHGSVFREARPLSRQHLNSRGAAKFILRSWYYQWLHRVGSVGGSGRRREVCQAEERQDSEVPTPSSSMGREAEVQRSCQCWSPGLQEAYTAVHRSLRRPSSRRVHTWNIKVTYMFKTLMKNVCHFPSLYISLYTKYSVSPRCVVVTAYYLFRGYW